MPKKTSSGTSVRIQRFRDLGSVPSGLSPLFLPPPPLTHHNTSLNYTWPLALKDKESALKASQLVPQNFRVLSQGRQPLWRKNVLFLYSWEIDHIISIRLFLLLLLLYFLNGIKQKKKKEEHNTTPQTQTCTAVIGRNRGDELEALALSSQMTNSAISVAMQSKARLLHILFAEKKNKKKNNKSPAVRRWHSAPWEDSCAAALSHEDDAEGGGEPDSKSH